MTITRAKPPDATTRCRCGCAQYVHRIEIAESYVAGGGTYQNNPMRVTRDGGNTGACCLCGMCAWYERAAEASPPQPKPSTNEQQGKDMAQQ